MNSFVIIFLASPDRGPDYYQTGSSESLPRRLKFSPVQPASMRSMHHLFPPKRAQMESNGP